MASAGTRLMCGPLPPLIGKGDNHSPPPVATSANGLPLPLQVKIEEGQKLQAQKSFSVSRRDAMLVLASQTSSAITFWSIEPAEARTSRSEIKRKILEKLEQLREKAGISKPKDDSQKNPSPQLSSGKDGNLKASPKNPAGSLVEVPIP